jgi:hypothetical protein
MHANGTHNRGPHASEKSNMVGQNDMRATMWMLSPAKRAALIACAGADCTLYKRYGAWSPCATGDCQTRICGNTVADLARDGLLSISTVAKHVTARLTPAGEDIARAALSEITPL